MEAASAGIPLLALDVGGNSEVVDASNGRLLPADATAGQIASALASILTAAPDEVASMRQASRRRWQERFDGRRNYVDFARRLVELAQVPTGRGQ
jgi:glycosyltransferase involved in cell wall biosynthesis